MSPEFDYIIVGAGSAGCVLANRLTENNQSRVLVIEAGGSDRKFWIQVPIGYGKTFFNPNVNWCYETEPQPGLNGNTSYWPRGKVLGGSSSINAMVYVRGQQEDFNDWRDHGNPGWGWDDVLPYFRKMETWCQGADAWRGGGGPLYANDPSADYHPLCREFIQAAKEYGLPLNPDYNGESQEGAATYQINTRNGFRMSSAKAYLRPALKRKNCEVLKNAQVTRILFNGKTAVGVEYSKGGEIHTARASREVILSAGAVNSPQILQLSGVGPAQLLQDQGIPVVIARDAVGRNLQDHIGYSHYYRSRVPTLNNELSPWWGKLKAGLQYVVFRKGPLSLSVNQAGGFFRSSPERMRPNLQIYFAAITYTTSPPGKRPLMQPDPWPGFLNSICQCRPASRGEIMIRSADPLTAPRIDPNYLSAQEDIDEMVEGFRFIREMSETPTLSRIIEAETRPGIDLKSEDKIIDDIRNRSTTVFHPSCTCIMGPDPERSVVDSQLRVHGLERLRVVDASVFPNVTSGNTNAPVIMVAEKAADMILAAK